MSTRDPTTHVEELLPAYAAGAGIAVGLVIGLGVGGGFAYVQLGGDVDRIEEIVGDGRVVSYLAAAPQTVVMMLEAQREAGPMAERAHAMLMAQPSGRLGARASSGRQNRLLTSNRSHHDRTSLREQRPDRFSTAGLGEVLEAETTRCRREESASDDVHETPRNVDDALRF